MTQILAEKIGPQIDSAFEILNYNQQLVQFADSKAGNLIVINSLFIFLVEPMN